jgi:TM2 domain-containing membrane protein YozV
LKSKKINICLFFLLVSFHFAKADRCKVEIKTNLENNKYSGTRESIENKLYCYSSNNHNFHKFKFKIKDTKKLTAAVLAFPLPFGFFGAHRIYMGTKPIVPIIYIATLGGCVGILPLIDFIKILMEKDLKKYENNSNVFMWNDPAGK